jgi:AraC family transcriptional regulator
VAAPEIDRIVFQTPAVLIGAFRCPVGHPSFADSGPIRHHCFVFPRTPVVIRHRDRAPFAADATLVTLYNQGQEYRRAAVSSDGDRCDWYAVAPPVIHDALVQLDPHAAEDDRRPIRFAFAPADARTYLQQRRLFVHVSREPAPDPMFVEEQIFDLLDQVLGGAYRRAEAAVASRPADGDLARACCELLGRRFAEPLTLADIAATLGVSPFHLCRIFRRVTGATLHAYRNQLRLRSALELLESAAADLTQLALDLGYSSHSHFTSSFRFLFGVPPSAIRQLVRARS